MKKTIENNDKEKNTKKQKKEKVIYYDDGSTISDMYCLRDTKKKYFKDSKSHGYTRRATEREKLHTFFEAFKMMIIPCVVVLTILLILYVILLIIVP